MLEEQGPDTSGFSTMRRFTLPLTISFAMLFGPAFAAPADETESGPDQTSPAIPQSALPDLTVKRENFFQIEEPLESEPPEILRDLSILPPAVAATREALMEAARNGDIEALRPVLALGEDATQVSFGTTVDDPIDHLRSLSGDAEGYEILAILLEVLEAGFVRVGEEKTEELYVWPYFAAHALDTLSPAQKVELFQLLTAGDLQDSQDFGSYIFYKAGIRADGSWAFFVAGD